MHGRWQWTLVMWAVACAALACGCAEGLLFRNPRSAPAPATAAARGLVPAPGKALVYVVRPGKQTTLRTRVACDGSELGTNSRGHFVYSMVDPGNHVFASGGEVPAELPIALEAGKMYYLEERIVPTIVGIRSKLIRLEDTDGREALFKCALSATRVAR
jgi:uncharacterized protein DUF2846